MRRLAVLAWPACACTPPTATPDFFETKVRPVLAERCFSCHTQTKLGGLEMVSQASLAKVVVPASPTKASCSPVSAPAKCRPPGGKLKDSEIAALETWIKDGAVWPASPTPVARSKDYVIRPEQRAYWAFQPVRKPAGDIDSLLKAAWKPRASPPRPPLREPSCSAAPRSTSPPPPDLRRNPSLSQRQVPTPGPPSSTASSPPPATANVGAATGSTSPATLTTSSTPPWTSPSPTPSATATGSSKPSTKTSPITPSSKPNSPPII
jgi:hypothetical protein